MKTQTAIAKIKAAGHDISDEYSTDECIGFLNTSIQEIANLLIAGKSPQMVKQVTIHNLESLPAGYVVSAGSYPIRITGQTITFLNDDTEIRFRYFAAPDQILDVTGTLPFVHDAINDVVVRAAVLIALNENEYDISQDKALVDEMKQAIAQGMAG